MHTWNTAPAIKPEIMHAIGSEAFDIPHEAELLAYAFSVPAMCRNVIGYHHDEDAQRNHGEAMLALQSREANWHPFNGVLVCGPAGAGKTTLVARIEEQLRYMHHIPSCQLLRKGYPVHVPEERDPENPVWFEQATMKNWVDARLQGLHHLVTEELPALKRLHQLSSDEIIIGGILQSLITLCAYTNQFDVDENTYEPKLPDALFNLLLLSLQWWAPRIIVYVDAPKEEREKRARQQAVNDPIELLKRKLPFEHDEVLRQMTIHTLRRLQEVAHTKNIPLDLVYFPTSDEISETLAGFTTIESPTGLCAHIQAIQNHRALHQYWGRITDCLDDETDSMCNY